MRWSVPVVVPVLALAMGCATSQPPVVGAGVHPPHEFIDIAVLRIPEAA